MEKITEQEIYDQLADQEGEDLAYYDVTKILFLENNLK